MIEFLSYSSIRSVPSLLYLYDSLPPLLMTYNRFATQTCHSMVEMQGKRRDRGEPSCSDWIRHPHGRG